MDFEEFIDRLYDHHKVINKVLESKEYRKEWLYIPVGDRFIKVTLHNIDKDNWE